MDHKLYTNTPRHLTPTCLLTNPRTKGRVDWERFGSSFAVGQLVKGNCHPAQTIVLKIICIPDGELQRAVHVWQIEDKVIVGIPHQSS